ncbi:MULTISPECIES: SMP-30/gluconolactonase/LRE family protein [unclassified Paenibacillus]|uniref:SMP-30/gluconolactonase/LRE family protein n=1 Tax=unclassified Paenibacillus TaxID=185978 RepID=UPI0024066DAB|nr:MULTISPECIES: SMP-30/gluconolactonase/LRE family protein [unclassified Paenibacillus]MDF9844496.1 DNA-binding beta-propeller fold protein YncE [Paenibacillus sp. PastF-2]MDF9851100.1 DNA-binding beta-propeller fold protein YncE [Paenibacillus sp. PastM-2]MDF9857672.1 DNA-binding beta-propeller fold protein YncE [Paenibacillus sp. PastF-1]MDH6482938.1 DNA-binding beta-propeller fold protein YncE [Paenibacillus sp. PastH-2]MDH6510363.1 DNA-binding beta-propeller fold protein YncE [Paenibacill
MIAKKWLLAGTVASLLLSCAAPAPVYAEAVPYESYNYNYWEEAVPAPAAYIPDRTLTGKDLGVGDFLDPADMVVADSGLIYIVDTGNARIICLDSSWKVDKVITGFDNGGKEETFKNPSGLYVNDEGNLFVADTDNGRIVVLSPDGELLRMIERPESDILPADFKFIPVKVTVDQAERVYVIAKGIFEGIMQFDENGVFIGYVGTNKVKRDYTEYIWRMFSTKAQKAQMALFVPTEFSNIDVDDKGFLYATNIDPGSKEPVKRLNPSGEDVLKRFGYFDVLGDIRYRISVGPSKFTDIKVLPDGMYSALDANQGKVFTYNDEGDLLYVYGGKGNQAGTFKIPAAIEYAGGSQLVLDRGKGNIVIFKPTRFGSIVNEAVGYHYNGEDAQAVPVWKEVLKLNANYDIAYIGIGKSLLMEKNNKEAMKYFKLGMDRDGYSVAFKRYRREVMQEHFGTFLTSVMLLAAVWIAYRIFSFWRRKRDSRASRQAPNNLKEGNAHEAGFH